MSQGINGNNKNTGELLTPPKKPTLTMFSALKNIGLKEIITGIAAISGATQEAAHRCAGECCVPRPVPIVQLAKDDSKKKKKQTKEGEE